MKKIWFLGISLFLCGSVYASNVKKSLVIMLDGCRADALYNTSTPNMDRLINGEWNKDYHCVYSFNAKPIPDANPNSAPNHTAIQTGVFAAKHNVDQNGHTKNGHYDEYPTVLTLLKKENPSIKTAFLYSWGEDGDIKQVDIDIKKQNSDIGNGKYAEELLTKETSDSPDAMVIYIDESDHGGHSTGFYPYGELYKWTIHHEDIMIGKMMEAISKRKNFKHEDWQIIITADHGGYHGSHGMWGGNASTIPFLLISKNVESGELVGTPHNADVPPTVLSHFGVDASKYDFDGIVEGANTFARDTHPLKEGLEVYLPFERGSSDNAIASDIVKVKEVGNVGHSTDHGKFQGYLSLDAKDGTNSFVELDNMEKLKLKNGKEFCFSMWVKLPKRLAEDSKASILSNKNWRDSESSGFALAANDTYVFNFGRKDQRKKDDLEKYDVMDNQWTFLSVMRDNNGVVWFFQGLPNGEFHWIIADDQMAAFVNQNAPWRIGQDASGDFPNLVGKVDDFAFWSHALTKEQLQHIYTEGLQGSNLESLL